MSDQQHRDGGDPSMEEILASIRKIISEEGDESPQPSQSSRPSESSADSEASESGSAMEEHTAADTADESETEEEVLDLTEEVEVEDGAMPAEEAAPAEETIVDEEAETASWEAEPVARTGETDVGGEETLPGPADRPDAEDASAAEAGAAAVEPPEQKETSAMTPDTGGIDAGTRDSVISDETSTTATAALTELARAANARDYGDDKPKSDADRILEQLVREALRPQLKAWLDENLPGLVEKVVRQEIRRISQRAEATAESESDD